MSLTKATYSMTLGSPLNAYDFMTAAQIADVQSFAPTLDVTTALQAAIDACAQGQRLYIPYGFYKHTGLTVSKSIFIYGDLPAHQFDNDSYNALNGGTILWQYEATGNNLTVQPPDLGDRRLQFHMQDVMLVGAIFTGSGTSGTPTSGHGLFIDGRNAQPETSAHVTLDRVFSALHADHGIYFYQSVYGCALGFIAANANGKNNFRVEGNAEPIGEFTVEHLRCFGGGTKSGATGVDLAGVYCTSVGDIWFGYITSTGAIGQSVLFGGGQYVVGVIHCETPGATHGINDAIVQFGNGVFSPSSANIQNINISPGANYAGSHILVKSGARRINSYSFSGNDVGLTGSHIKLESNAQACNFYSNRTDSTFAVSDSDGDNFIQGKDAGFRAAMFAQQANATGDGTIVTVPYAVEEYDLGGNYNDSTYVFTATYNAIYQVSAAVLFTGADGANHTNFTIDIVKNGLVTILKQTFTLKPTSYNAFISDSIKLLKGDAIIVRAYADGGAKTVDLGSADASQSFFSVSFLRPLY